METCTLSEVGVGFLLALQQNRTAVRPFKKPIVFKTCEISTNSLFGDPKPLAQARNRYLTVIDKF